MFNATAKPSYGKGKQKGKTETFWKALFHQLVERQGWVVWNVLWNVPIGQTRGLFLLYCCTI